MASAFDPPGPAAQFLDSSHVIPPVVEIGADVYDSVDVASHSNKGWSGVPGFEEVEASATTAPPDETDAAMTVPALEFDYQASVETTARDDSPANRLTLPPPPDDSWDAPTLRPNQGRMGAELAKKLTTDKPRAPPPPNAAARAAYRNVIIATVVASVLLGLAIAYTTKRASVQTAPERPVPMAPKGAVAQPEPAVPAPKAPAAPVRPMVTVVSVPPGAQVEINGAPAGTAPVVKPAPEGVVELEITVKLSGHEAWRAQVRPNELGHYSVNAKLRAKR